MQDTSNVCAWNVAVSTRIVVAVLFTLDTGASVVMNHPLDTESTIYVSCLASLVAIHMANLRSRFREILLLSPLSLVLEGGLCQERRELGLTRKSC